MDSSDSELSFHSGNQWRSLEQSTSEGLESSSDGFFAFRNCVVETNDTDIFFTGALLGFDETSCSVDTDDETAGDFGIQGTRVAGFFTSEDTFHPGDDFVGGRVGGFVEVDYSGSDGGVE